MSEAELPESVPLPDGARDVLPTEQAELADIERRLRSAVGAFGYREVRTPLLEFAEAMDRAQAGGVGSAFRLFDDHGEVLVVRPDLTIPVARLVAGRLASHPGPLRVAYVGEALRPARAGKAQRFEERQAGIELVGPDGPAADAEVVALVATALRELGIDDLRVGVGDVSLTQAVLTGVGVGDADQTRLRDAVRSRNLVAWRRIADALPLPAAARAVVAELPMRRGDRQLLDQLAGEVPPAASACERLGEVLSALESHGASTGVMVDLGVLRDWGYYSGIVFEAYAPGTGRPVAIGGRYDGLIARFGAARPAVGAAMLLDRIHEALAARNGQTALLEGVVLAGGIDAELTEARRLRSTGVPVVGVSSSAGRAEALAEADGWRYVARREGAGFIVLDRADGSERRVDDVLEVVRSQPL